MHHYPFHIGDYRSGCIHLTQLERWVYRDLLDIYYDTEQPLPLDHTTLFRLAGARSSEHKDAVLTVLDDKFVRTEAGYVNDRCEAEVAKYRKAKLNHWGRKLTKDQRAAAQGERNAAKASATPRWLTKQDRALIAEIYAEAATKTASTGVKHEVDHIIPLRSKQVCGLHVPWNLRAIPSHKNRAKSNTLIET